MERRPSTDHRAWNGPSYLSVEGNDESSIRICEVWDDGGHDGPSWPRRSVTRSVDPAAFDRFLVIRILLLLGFVFILNSSKNLVFGVKLLNNFQFYCLSIELSILGFDITFSESILCILWFIQVNFRILFILIKVSAWILTLLLWIVWLLAWVTKLHN